MPTVFLAGSSYDRPARALMVVHIVGTRIEARGGTPVGLCGAEVDGFYVRHKDGMGRSRRYLCADCLAESLERHAEPTDATTTEPREDD
jgi:hypothetical protein